MDRSVCIPDPGLGLSTFDVLERTLLFEDFSAYSELAERWSTSLLVNGGSYFPKLELRLIRYVDADTGEDALMGEHRNSMPTLAGDL